MGPKPIVHSSSSLCLVKGIFNRLFSILDFSNIQSNIFFRSRRENVLRPLLFNFELKLVKTCKKCFQSPPRFEFRHFCLRHSDLPKLTIEFLPQIFVFWLETKAEPLIRLKPPERKIRLRPKKKWKLGRSVCHSIEIKIMQKPEVKVWAGEGWGGEAQWSRCRSSTGCPRFDSHRAQKFILIDAVTSEVWLNNQTYMLHFKKPNLLKSLKDKRCLIIVIILLAFQLAQQNSFNAVLLIIRLNNR